jgi:hypothetical protein
VTVDPDAARGRAERAGEHSQRRGLAGTVRAEKPYDLTRTHREAEIGDGQDAAVILRDALDLDHQGLSRTHRQNLWAWPGSAGVVA